jgi:predicted DNA-binding antitoxin AbrB/MazE fold protein
MKTVNAVYEHGVFRPLQSVELPEHTEVEFEPKVYLPSKGLRQSAKGNPQYSVGTVRDRGKGFGRAHDEHQP